ncbi:MAG: hypothetical protein IPI27_09425 [Betaproteobacteria bacterium]|nr:hypothetical protein [Betaproteobacteria bacterium]
MPGSAAFAARAEALRQLAIARGDQPYGAVVVKGGRIVGEGVSAVVTDADPTAHAERQAIRDAQRRAGTPDPLRMRAPRHLPRLPAVRGRGAGGAHRADVLRQRGHRCRRSRFALRRMAWLRALAVWLLIVAVETLHGIARTLWLAPQVGDHVARQIGVLTGSLLISPSPGSPSAGSACAAPDAPRRGALWVVLMLAFEIALGGRVFGFRLGADRRRVRRLARGGLMGFGLAALLLMPFVTARMRGRVDPGPSR